MYAVPSVVKVPRSHVPVLVLGIMRAWKAASGTGITLVLLPRKSDRLRPECHGSLSSHYQNPVLESSAVSGYLPAQVCEQTIQIVVGCEALFQ